MNTLPSPFSSSNLGIEYTLEDACLSLTSLDHWSERYRQLFRLAEKIVPLDESFRIASNSVEGCESPVWLIHYYEPQTQLNFLMADSDSKIIRGLLVILLCSCNGKHSNEIEQLQLETTLNKLDLGKYLTPSRSNGLVSVMQKIKSFVS